MKMKMSMKTYVCLTIVLYPFTSTNRIFSAFQGWTMANWPCKTEDAIKARDDLAKVGKYTPRLLPAYDVAGRLIEPPNYEAKLRGALAKVVVTISRWSIKDVHSLCADIVERAHSAQSRMVISHPRLLRPYSIRGPMSADAPE